MCIKIVIELSSRNTSLKRFTDPWTGASPKMLLSKRRQPRDALSPTTASKVQMYTNKEFLIAEDKKFIATLDHNSQPNNYAILNQKATPRFQSSGSKVDLFEENRIGIADLKLSINRSFVGKYLLCRTIMPPHKITSITTVVDDPDGALAVRLALFNFANATQNLEQVLPVGIILAIKNPWFKLTSEGGLLVRCDNPGDVVMFSDEDIKKLHSNLCWKGQIPQEYQSRAITYSKTDPKFTKFKNLGNKSFVEKQYVDSIRYYTQGINIDGENLDVLANRAAAFINLRCYRKAMEDLTLLLNLDPIHVKGIYRMVKSLWGLRRYSDALEMLHIKFNEEPKLIKNKDLNQMMDKAKVLLKQSKYGEFDIVELLKMDASKETIDIAEYSGPVTIKKINAHKGRGLFATENIYPGQLIICSKAYAFHVMERTEDAFENSLNYEKDCAKPPGHDQTVVLISQKISLEPESGKGFYTLYAGEELEYLQEDDERVEEVDMERIHEIVTFNAFSKTHENRDDFSSPFPELRHRTASHGVWILPSFINHSCWDGNCAWECFGDVMIIRAIKPIKTGEEILMPYSNPSEPFENRIRVCISHEFVCQCTLCKFQACQSEKANRKREQILEKLQNLVKNGEQMNLKQVLKNVADLESLHKNGYSKFNVFLADPIFSQIAGTLFDKGDFKNSSLLLEKIHKVCTGTPLGRLAVIAAASNLICHHLLDSDPELIDHWINRLKHDLILAFGSVSAIKIVASKALEVINATGYVLVE